MRILATVLLLFLAACATHPISDTEATPVPSDRVLDYTYLTPKPDTGQILVKRDSGVGGSACSSRIFLNAKPVADLFSSEKVSMYLPAGRYILSAWPNNICGGGMSEVQADVIAGQTIRFRVGYGSNGDFSIYPTAF